MRLTCFKLTNNPLQVVPADVRRDWMDAVPDRHIYRCLPIAIANSHGWEILCRDAMTVSWDGTVPADGMTVTPDNAEPPCAKSHFSSGILTFELGLMFRTDPGWNLMVTGPLNGIKDGIAPLSGVVESDWLPYPFTMNWRFTRRNIEVRFEKDEPIGHIMPVPKGAVSDVEPVYDRMEKHPDLVEQYTGWRDHRQEFMKRFHKREQTALTEKWQKLYQKGTLPDGTTIDGHMNKLRAAPFRDLEPAPAVGANGADGEAVTKKTAAEMAPTREARDLTTGDAPKLTLQAVTDSPGGVTLTAHRRPAKKSP